MEVDTGHYTFWCLDGILSNDDGVVASALFWRQAIWRCTLLAFRDDHLRLLDLHGVSPHLVLRKGSSSTITVYGSCLENCPVLGACLPNQGWFQKSATRTRINFDFARDKSHIFKIQAEQLNYFTRLKHHIFYYMFFLLAYETSDSCPDIFA